MGSKSDIHGGWGRWVGGMMVEMLDMRTCVKRSLRERQDQLEPENTDVHTHRGRVGHSGQVVLSFVLPISYLLCSV